MELKCFEIESQKKNFRRESGSGHIKNCGSVTIINFTSAVSHGSEEAATIHPTNARAILIPIF